ncbi:LysE family transporter [Cytobacillus gottheilii]|uniref:LysE family transporter n=1 Tax=Cytobacillus gottheilii TaxID=859144 RepID=A0ABX8FHP6_9BACI|nr:LysE family transporter [Cytobacillus gottheilii]QVY63531.1 LysE family transporter [Cytobacillus gottheilii]
MIVFFSYILLGLSLAAPIGPVNAAVLDKGIKKGFFHGWLVGLGAMTADVVYMFAVFMGLVHFLEFPFVKAFLWSFGFFVLVYTGIETIMGAGKIISPKRTNDDTKIKSFLSGFFISISNPLTILFWLGIYGSVLAKTVTEFDHVHLALYSIAIFIGLIIWDLFILMIASGFRKTLSGKTLALISIFSGISLIGFGLYFGYQAILLLFFS